MDLKGAGWYFLGGAPSGVEIHRLGASSPCDLTPQKASTFPSGETVAVDDAGNIYVAGVTEASLYPTTPAAIARAYRGGSSDGLVTKFDPAGNLVYSSFIGGSSTDEIRAIAVDSAGNAYLTKLDLVIGYKNADSNPYRIYVVGSID